MHYCFRIIQVSTLLWLQEIYIIDACVEHIKYRADIFSIRCFQIIWIKKPQLRQVQALHACYVGKVGVHLTCVSYSSHSFFIQKNVIPKCHIP